MLVSNVRGGVNGQKLQKDVTRLNSAVKVYLANGGDLSGVSDPREVLTHLKSVAGGSANRQVVGLKGSALDYRVVAEMQTSGQATSDELRALWDPVSNRFVLTNTGGIGVRAFVIDENAAEGGEESRSTNLKYAMNDGWVWDYQDRSDNVVGGPSNLPPGGGVATLPPAVDPPSAAPLLVPVIEVPGGDYPLTDFPKAVAITNPNDPGVSELLYSTIAGIWSIYDGPVQVEPGDELEVRAISIDPDNWSDSDTVDEEYATVAVSPELELSLPETVNYIEMGGSLVAGNYDDPTLVSPGDVSLVNGDVIPDIYESNAYFQVYWTYDGSDPVGAADRGEGENFTNGFSSQEIPLSIADWGTGPELTVKVQTESFDLDVFGNSEVTQQVIGIETIALRAPQIEIDGGTISFIQNPDFGDLPVGTRIFYTTDGTDPGVDASGEPVGGTEYVGPFDLNDDADLTVRVYPPEAYTDWFTPSASTSESYVSPYTRVVHIGGRFALPDGTFRNIARLGPEGGLDSTFNPGLGASSGSLVGAIAPQGGGNILVGGDFESMNTSNRFGVVRMREDGSVDESFNAGLE